MQRDEAAASSNVLAPEEKYKRKNSWYFVKTIYLCRIRDKRDKKG